MSSPTFVSYTSSVQCLWCLLFCARFDLTPIGTQEIHVPARTQTPPPPSFFVFCFSLYSPIFFFFQSTFVSPPPEISVLPKLFSSWFFRSVFLQLYIHIYISITWLRIQSIQKSTNLEGFQCSFLMVLASVSWKRTRCTPNGLCFLLFLPWQSIRRDTFLFFNGRNYRKNISQWTTTREV